MIKLTKEEYQDMQNNYEGLCTTCKETQDTCEPDASEYECESCGENTVYGVPELLLMGKLEIV